MEKNRIMEAFLSLGLLVLAVLCVAVPFFVLVTGDGTYSWQFGDPATKKMMAEIALLFVLLSGILLLGKRPLSGGAERLWFALYSAGAM